MQSKGGFIPLFLFYCGLLREGWGKLAIAFGERNGNSAQKIRFFSFETLSSDRYRN
jgi:hypothetical protein